MKKFNILFLSTFSKDLPAQKALEKGLDKTLKFKEGCHNVFFDFMDSTRLKEEELSYFKDYLKARYRTIDFDFVIAWDIKAVSFICKNRDLFNHAQRILLEVDKEYLYSEKCNSDEDIIIASNEDYLATLKEIIRIQNPGRMVVIGEASEPVVKFRLEGFKKEIREISSHIKIEYVLDQDMGSICSKLKGPFKEKTVALFLLMFSDGRGTFRTSYQVAQNLAEESSIPLFSYYEPLIGSGIVGGYLISFEMLGEYMGNVILEHDQNEEKYLIYTPMKSVYDYKALKKWGIPFSNIPANAEIINRPPDLFQCYKEEIFIAFIFFLFVLIVFFLLYRQFVVRKMIAKLLRAEDQLRIKNEALNQLSGTDPLTGLNNRRFVEKAITDEMNRNKRFGHPVSLLLLDLDFFKEINDKKGHVLGDKALSMIAEVIRNNIRVTDRAARWGGDEFLILSANTELKGMLSLAEKIRKKVQMIELGEDQKISVSIGVAEYEKYERFLAWYERADKALYNAKANGRNRVEFLESEHRVNKIPSLLKLEWKESFLSGNETIDREHLALFDVSNDLIDAFLSKGSRERILSLIEELFLKTVAHFKNEEVILKKTGYSGFDQHSNRHKELIEVFSQLKIALSQNRVDDFIFLEFLTEEVFLKHILEEDRDYFSWLE